AATAAAPAAAAEKSAEKPASASAAPAPAAATADKPASKVVDINRGAPARPAAAAAPASSAAASVPAAPSPRPYARELGLDITTVEGSGPGGRVSVDDVKAQARSVIAGGGGGGARIAAAPLPDFSQWGEVEVQPLKTIRRITAERMAQTWATVPHVT